MSPYHVQLILLIGSFVMISNDASVYFCNPVIIQTSICTQVRVCCHKVE